MAKEKKCNWCENTTKSSREDFCDIGWTGVQFNRDKPIYACPDHKLNIREEMIKQARERYN